MRGGIKGYRDFTGKGGELLAKCPLFLSNRPEDKELATILKAERTYGTYLLDLLQLDERKLLNVADETLIFDTTAGQDMPIFKPEEGEYEQLTLEIPKHNGEYLTVSTQPQSTHPTIKGMGLIEYKIALHEGEGKKKSVLQGGIAAAEKFAVKKVAGRSAATTVFLATGNPVISAICGSVAGLAASQTVALKQKKKEKKEKC